jgi:hypothetical protein
MNRKGTWLYRLTLPSGGHLFGRFTLLWRIATKLSWSAPGAALSTPANAALCRIEPWEVI